MNFEKLFPGVFNQEWVQVNLNECHLEQTSDTRDVVNQEALLYRASQGGRFHTFGGFGENRKDLWKGFEPVADQSGHMIH
jgi:hypothetical protein